MATNWIKVEVTTPDKPEVGVIGEVLRMDIDTVAGKLLRVWCWADQHTTPGEEVAGTCIDRIARRKGFAVAMAAAKWLVPAGRNWVFPSFERHNGQGAKTRAVTARRVQKLRESNDTNVTSGAKCNGENVTSALPEGEIDKKKNNAAHCPPMNPPGSGGGLDAVDIAALYPRRERMAEAVAEIARQIAAGEDPAAIADGTRAAAAVIVTLPGGALSTYVPGALKFFRDKRWADDPRTLARQTNGSNGAPVEKLDLGGRRPARTINISDDGELS